MFLFFVAELMQSRFERKEKEIQNAHKKQEESALRSQALQSSIESLYSHVISSQFDLQGNILAELGKANAPQWSPDGKWIVYMYDVDDGHQLRESEIWISAADGSVKKQITNTNDRKEIYPSWKNKISEILFSDDRGVVYKAILDINN